MRPERFETDIDLHLEGIELKRGQRYETRIRTSELADGTWIQLPVIVARGAKPGPVFYLGAAFHGDEVNGIDIVTRFLGGLDLKQLSGTILAVPAQNPLALQQQHRYFVGHFMKSPLDQSPADPWASFPGDADGNIAAQIAHVLFDRLMRHADFFVDVHTPTTGGRYAPFAFLPPPRVGPIAGRSKELACAFGADFILSTEEGVYVMEQSPHVVLARRGVVAMGVELGEGGRLEEEVSQQGLKGLTNVFRAIGMLPGEATRFGRNLVISHQHVVRAHRGGLVKRFVNLNDEVRQGDLVATITSIFGEVVEEIRAPISGPVVRVATFPVVSAGERIVQFGVPA